MDGERVTVDFIFPAESEVPDQKTPAVTRLGACVNCGGNDYHLASEIRAGNVRGLPASRMYECTGCGEYRLG